MSELIYQDGSYTKNLHQGYYHASAGATVRLLQSYEPVDYNDQASYPGVVFPDGSMTLFLKHGLYHLSSDASVTMVAPPSLEDHDNQFAVPGANLPVGEEGSPVPETGIEYDDQHPGFQYADPSMDNAPIEASHEAVASFFASRLQAEQLGQTHMPQPSMNSASFGNQVLPGQGLVPQAHMGYVPTSSQAAAAAPLLPTQAATVPVLTTPQADKYIPRGLLSDARMAQLDSLPYETMWLSNNGIHPSILDGFTSKMKFEVLFGHGVFRIGDVFKADNVIGSILFNMEATVVSFPTYILNAYPDMQITNTVTGATSILSSCRGVSQLYCAMSAPPYPQSKAFHTFRVYRNGVNLGDLFKIRQGIEVWLEEKDLWMVRTTGKGRARRGPNKLNFPGFGGPGGPGSSGGSMGGPSGAYSGGAGLVQPAAG